MAISKLVKLGWAGKEYQIKVTMRIVNILGQHVNIWQVLNQLNNRDVRPDVASLILSIFLKEAGADVEQDDIYSALHWGDESEKLHLAEALGQLLGACIPEPPKKKAQQSRKPRKPSAKK